MKKVYAILAVGMVVLITVILVGGSLEREKVEGNEGNSKVVGVYVAEREMSIKTKEIPEILVIQEEDVEEVEASVVEIEVENVEDVEEEKEAGSTKEVVANVGSNNSATSTSNASKATTGKSSSSNDSNTSKTSSGSTASPAPKKEEPKKEESKKEEPKKEEPKKTNDNIKDSPSGRDTQLENYLLNSYLLRIKPNGYQANGGEKVSEFNGYFEKMVNGNMSVSQVKSKIKPMIWWEKDYLSIEPEWLIEYYVWEVTATQFMTTETDKDKIVSLITRNGVTAGGGYSNVRAYWDNAKKEYTITALTINIVD